MGHLGGDVDLQGVVGAMSDRERAPDDGAWQQMYLGAPGLRLAGGTDEILRNIIAERVLGLPPEIRADKGDIAAYKKESDANDINKVKRYLVDTPDALLYESEVMGQNEFHFYGNVTVGDRTFNCEDIKGPRHMQADVEAMWKSCQSLARK